MYHFKRAEVAAGKTARTRAWFTALVAQDRRAERVRAARRIAALNCQTAWYERMGVSGSPVVLERSQSGGGVGV